MALSVALLQEDNVYCEKTWQADNQLQARARGMAARRLAWRAAASALKLQAAARGMVARRLACNPGLQRRTAVRPAVRPALAAIVQRPRRV